VWCDKPYRGVNNPEWLCRWCSVEWRAAEREVDRAARVWRTRWARLQKERARAGRQRVFIVEGTCRSCGFAFSREWRADAGSEPRYCDARCREAFKGTRRADAKITPGQRRRVFERDRWICQICRVPIEPWLRWPDDRCAVVDHVIPLAAGEERGGVHAMHNWQTAHNECNRDKADSYAQMALF
jgi:hypothetical protein